MAGTMPLKQEYGLLGWPLVPSVRFPDEQTLACPKCGSLDVTLTSVPAGRGSGPSGRYRLGDSYRPVNRCESCGHTAYGEVKHPR